MESIIKLVLDKNWADLTKVVEGRAANKIKTRVSEKKKAITASMNNGMGEDIPDID